MLHVLTSRVFNSRSATKRTYGGTTATCRNSDEDRNAPMTAHQNAPMTTNTETKTARSTDIDHEILLTKMNCSGLQGKTFDWFKSYLTNRTQRCSVNDCLSSPLLNVVCHREPSLASFISNLY